jgi:hypothetical protein
VLVDGNVVRLGLAAPAGHVDDARHRFEAPLQHPVLERLQIGNRIVGRPDHAIAKDFADGTGGRYLRLCAVRQRRELRQAVGHPLLRLLIGEVVRELHLDVGQAEQRYGTDGLDVGDAGHLNFERDGDVAFDFLGRLAGALRDDVHQRRHRIRVGLDIQRQEAGDAGREHHDQHDDDQHALTQREGHDRVHEEAGTAT